MYQNNGRNNPKRVKPTKQNKALTSKYTAESSDISQSKAKEESKVVKKAQCQKSIETQKLAVSCLQFWEEFKSPVYNSVYDPCPIDYSEPIYRAIECTKPLLQALEGNQIEYPLSDEIHLKVKYVSYIINKLKGSTLTFWGVEQ